MPLLSVSRFNPLWEPSFISQVTTDLVTRQFEPLSALGVEELGLSKGGFIRARGQLQKRYWYRPGVLQVTIVFVVSH